MKAQIQKITRYMIAGGMGALINFLIYFILLKLFSVYYLLASIISFTLSLIAGFYFQKHFTFQDGSQNNIKKQMTYYYVFSSINLIINVILLSFFVEVMKMDQVLAKILTLAILAVWSFFIYQNYIFKQEY